jgi:hypothetical protein
MTWRRQIDYHGSRAYGPPAATETATSRIQRAAGLYAARAKRWLRTLIKFGIAPATETPPVVARNQRGFSLLGSDRNARIGHGDCPFPEAPARTHRSIAPKERVR